MNLRMLTYMVVKSSSHVEKEQDKTSLVVLLILNSYTNHAKVKIAFTGSH